MKGGIILNKALILALLIALAGVAFAAGNGDCIPKHELGFSATVADADQIIIGEKAAQSQPGLGVDPATYVPDWADIKIISVLKGTPKSTTIQIKTNWPCEDGFTAPPDENKYIMFFGYDTATGEYHRVTTGYNLGATMYRIDDNSFSYFDDETYATTTTTIKAFTAKYGLNLAAAEQVAAADNNGAAPISIAGQQDGQDFVSPLLKYIPLSKETIIWTVIIALVLVIIIGWFASTARHK